LESSVVVAVVVVVRAVWLVCARVMVARLEDAKWQLVELALAKAAV
jgi:hypothetical protein